eukprot:TRINITY_DN63167_c0_g1_i1.p1 TRINITY_DN63167_c0_g1~~TRINITY_DN63167_c0_g1_i1.p1  ORF type:complete len:1288 (-),score=213.50 TRINITY_DN63167_c0_g1_i1:1033-4896(-)
MRYRCFIYWLRASCVRFVWHRGLIDLALILLVALTSPRGVHGVVHVSLEGKDSPDCGAALGPAACLTLRHATAVAGQRLDGEIRIQAGRHFIQNASHAVVNHSVRIAAVGGTATIDCASRSRGVDIQLYDNMQVVVQGLVFQDCVASDEDRWGIGPNPAWCYRCSCSMQYCSRGGAVTISNATGQPVLNSSVFFKNCTFHGNAAAQGGAVQVGLFRGFVHSVLSFEDCTFTNNVARVLGGPAVGIMLNTAHFRSYFPEGNVSTARLQWSNFTFTRCRFVKNKGATEGAVAFWGVAGEMHVFRTWFEDCLFERNIGGNGAAIAVHFPIPIEDMHGIYYPGGSSGAVRPEQAMRRGSHHGLNTFRLTRVNFIENYAGDRSVGGAVMFAVPSKQSFPYPPNTGQFRRYEYTVQVSTDDCLFEGNEAYVGGAYVVSNGQHIFRNTTFKGNIARHTGGAFCLGCVGGGDGAVEAFNVSFIGNKASVAGSSFSAASSGQMKFHGCNFFMEGSREGITDFEASNVGPFLADSTTSWSCRLDQELLKASPTVSQGLTGVLDPEWNRESILVLVNHIHLSCFWCKPSTYSVRSPQLMGPLVSTSVLSSATSWKYRSITYQGRYSAARCRSCPFGGTCPGNESIILARPGQYGTSCQDVQDKSALHSQLTWFKLPLGAAPFDEGGGLETLADTEVDLAKTVCESDSDCCGFAFMEGVAWLKTSRGFQLDPVRPSVQSYEYFYILERASAYRPTESAGFENSTRVPPRLLQTEDSEEQPTRRFFTAQRERQPSKPMSVSDKEDDVKCQQGPTQGMQFVRFVTCPEGYCNGGEWATPCNGNRTGLLCGSCQKNFTRAYGTVACVPDHMCSWIWILPMLGVTFAYAMYCYVTGATPYGLIDMIIFHYQVYLYVIPVSSSQLFRLTSVWSFLSRDFDVLTHISAAKPKGVHGMCLPGGMNQIQLVGFLFVVVAFVPTFVWILYMANFRQCLPRKWKVNAAQHGKTRRPRREVLGLALSKAYLGITNMILGATVQLVTCVDLEGFSEKRLFIMADHVCYTMWQMLLVLLLPILLLSLLFPICLAILAGRGICSGAVGQYALRLQQVAHESGIFRAECWWTPQALALFRGVLAVGNALLLLPASRALWNIFMLIVLSFVQMFIHPFLDHGVNVIHIALLSLLMIVATFEVGDAYLLTSAAVPEQVHKLVITQLVCQVACLGTPVMAVAGLKLCKKRMQRALLLEDLRDDEESSGADVAAESSPETTSFYPGSDSEKAPSTADESASRSVDSDDDDRAVPVGGL